MLNSHIVRAGRSPAELVHVIESMCSVDNSLLVVNCGQRPPTGTSPIPTPMSPSISQEDHRGCGLNRLIPVLRNSNGNKR